MTKAATLEVVKRDFSLNDDDMKAISKLDIGYSEIINYYSACTAKVLNEVKIRK